MKVKLFTKHDLQVRLDDDITKFIEGKNIIDIKYSTSSAKNAHVDYVQYSALVMYED